jgi:hypothetical protein
MNAQRTQVLREMAHPEFDALGVTSGAAAALIVISKNALRSKRKSSLTLRERRFPQ